MDESYRQAFRLAMHAAPMRGPATVFQVPGMSKLQCFFRGLALATALASPVFLSACSGLSIAGVTVYKIDVVQGNVVTREQVQALRPGQPKALVRDILGSPLVASVFHADRWDYVFAFSRQGQAAQQRRFTVHFRDGVLERFEGADLPSEAEFVASLDRRSPAGAVPVLQASEEQLKPTSPQPVSTSPAPAPVAERREYPPLEPSGSSR